MRVLLNAKKEIASKNGEMILTGLIENVREVLSMLGFLDYFTVVDPGADELGYYDFCGNAAKDTER